MTAKELALEELKKNKDNYKKNGVIEVLMKAMDTNVPESMRYIFAMYSAITYINHFRKKIEVWKGNLIPINAIFVVLAKSGGGKTSNIKRGHKALDLGYKLIDTVRTQIEREWAESVGENPRRLRPLTNALSTGPGLVRVVNEFANEHIGCPNVQVDELVNAISNQKEDLKDNIQIVSEVFDDGDMEAKALKDTERQSDPIYGMGISAIFVGAQNELVKSEKLLEYLIVEMETKLFRRSTICCPVFEPKEEQSYSSYEEVFEEREHKQKEMVYNGMLIQKQSQAIFNHMNGIDKVTFSKRANMVVEAIKDKYSGSKRVDREEIHWRVRKLAGCLASLECEKEIQPKHVMEALHFSESYLDDWDRFMTEASAQGHEKVILHFNTFDTELTAHHLKKQKIIKKVEDLHEIVKLVNTSDTKYRIEVFNNSLRKIKEKMLERKEGIEVHTVSFKPILSVNKLVTGLEEKEAMYLASLSFGEYTSKQLMDGIPKKNAKQLIAKALTIDGYKTIKAPFADVGEIMAKDFAYMPYELREGKRADHNIVGGTSLIILDIDKNVISDEEAHDLFSDWKHHIARSSDKTNPFKFRIMFEADTIIELDSEEWLIFLEKVAEFLSLDIDILARAQFFYGYSDRKILSSLDGEKFPARELMSNLTKAVVRTTKVQSIKEQTAVFGKRREYYRRLYEYKRGDGLHTILFSVMAHTYNKGLTEQQSIDIIEEALVEVRERTGKVPRKSYMKSLNKQRRRMYGNE